MVEGRKRERGGRRLTDVCKVAARTRHQGGGEREEEGRVPHRKGWPDGGASGSSGSGTEFPVGGRTRSAGEVGFGVGQRVRRWRRPKGGSPAGRV
jgi:hypothetical protein